MAKGSTMLPFFVGVSSLGFFFMSVEKPDLYLFLFGGCELCTPSEGERNNFWNKDLLSRVIGECSSIEFGEIWIAVPGLVLQENSFIDYLHVLSSLCDTNLIDSMIIQCNAESLKVKSAENIYQRYKLSLVVCDRPNCGVGRPTKIISNFLLAKSIFKSVSFVGPSPAECVIGLSAGTNIRQRCLCGKNLFFIMSNYIVQKCPFGQLSVLGDLEHESLKDILEKPCENEAEFSPPPFDIAYSLNTNICVLCKEKMASLTQHQA